MPIDTIVVNPVRVLVGLAPASDTRTSLPIRSWANNMIGNTDPGSIAVALSFLVRHCSELDKIRERTQLSALDLLRSVERDLVGSDKRPSALSKLLKGPIVIDFARMLDSHYEPIDTGRLYRICSQLDELREKLYAVTTPHLATVTTQLAYGLGDLKLLLDRSHELRLWLLSPETLVVGQDRLVHYGLTLERVGLPKAAKLALGIAFALAGLFPPVALAAATGSLAMLVADGWNEEDFFGRRSALEG